MFPPVVKQMMAVKEEAPEYHRSCADLHDPKLHHLEGKQDGVCISLGAAGDQCYQVSSHWHANTE